MSHSATASSSLDNRGYHGPLIRGVNPATLIDQTLRDRITTSLYWAESCFGLSTATLLDRATELNFLGGTAGVAQKPTPFLCLLFKLLTLTPEHEIVELYLTRAGDEWKYVRALAVFYVRLTAEDPAACYRALEPYLTDRRKLRRRRKDGWVLTYVDELVDELLTKERVCGVSLWKLPSRTVLEDEGRLEERESSMREELEQEDEEEEEEDEEEPDERAEEEDGNEEQERDGHRRDGEEDYDDKEIDHDSYMLNRRPRDYHQSDSEDRASWTGRSETASE